MKLALFRHNWGLPDAPWEEKLRTVQLAGYAGFETGALKPEDFGYFRELLARFKLRFIPQIFTVGSTVADQVKAFRRLSLAVSIFHPARLNCHSGSDTWHPEEAASFYREIVSIESDLGFPVVHETHRGRCFFHPWPTLRLLEKFPSLRLCADFSHWVCVCERLLVDEEALLRFCAERVMHIHARVGYENGPQVPDPRAPEWQSHVQAHEQWWRWVWEAQDRLGAAEITMTPEFGPPSYLHTMPFSQAPVANLSEICAWQSARQSARFKEWSGSVAL